MPASSAASSGFDAAPRAGRRGVGTGGIFVAGAALVVASSTLVTDFAGFVALGWGFAIALLLAFLVIVPLAVAVVDITVAHPQAGGIYHFARRIIGGRAGTFGGVLLSFCFFGMFLFGASAEGNAGAYALRALCGSTLPVGWFVVVIAIVAVTPNLLGFRTAAGITAVLLVVMLGIRWFFGLAGFLGWAENGAWAGANLVAPEGMSWLGTHGILSGGLALGLWTFVGIEGTCTLVEETRQPARTLPRGMVLALVAILLTSLVMGVGATGTMPLAEWRALVAGPAGEGGASPQLAFGRVMFGGLGRLLMALASLAATLSTLTVAFAAVPRVLWAMARDGHCFGSLSRVLARVHPRTRAPVNATLAAAGVYLGLALCAGAVMDWLYAAAYLWIFRYVALHALALVNRWRHPRSPRAFRGRGFVPLVVVGLVGVLAAFHFGFAGRHLAYAPRALAVLAGGLVLTLVSVKLAPRPRRPAASPVAVSVPVPVAGAMPEPLPAVEAWRRAA